MIQKILCGLLCLGFGKAMAMEVQVSCDALYWHTTETADWALLFPANTNDRTYTFKTLSFDWDPGFRVGIGLHREEGFATHLAYTRFRPDTVNKVQADQIRSELFGAKLALLGFFQEASFSDKIDYNMFDWGLSYPLCPSDCFHVRPMVGIKAGWINQSLLFKGTKTVDLLNILTFPVTAAEAIKNDFWGVGPQIGMDTHWIFGYGLYLAGEASIALLWGHWTITDNFSDSFLTRIETKVADREFGAWMVRGLLGIGYSYCSFSVQVGYEIQDWFNQYQVFDDGTGGHSNDLIVQGLTAGIQWGF